MKDRKTLLNLLLLVLGAAALVLFVVFDLDRESMTAAFEIMNHGWMLGILLCMGLYYGLDAAKYALIARVYGHRQSPGESFTVSILGFFYSAITPFASGGQPFQVYHMYRRGIPTATATSIIAATYIAYHSAYVTLGLLGLIFCFHGFAQGSAVYVIAFLFGLLVQLSLMAACVLSAVLPEWTERVGASIVRFVLRLPILRRKQEKQTALLQSWHNFVTEYHDSLMTVRKHWPAFLLSYFIGILELGVFMSVTYCAYRALGFQTEHWLSMMLIQSMLSLAVAFIPLPGASVASEGGFLLIFNRYFGDFRAMGMLTWRLASYYLTLVVGYICVVVSQIHQRRGTAVMR